MKRIILFVALALVLVASLAWGWSAGLMGGGVASTAAPTEKLRAHFENSDTITSGSPAGYNSNADQTWALSNGAEYSTTNNVAPGSYVLHLLGTSGTTRLAEIATDINKSAGTIKFRLYSPSSNTETFQSILLFPVDASNYIEFRVGNAVTTYDFTYRYAATNRLATITGITQNAWHDFELRWDTTAHAGDYVQIIVDSVEGTSNQDGITALTGTPSNLQLGYGLGYNPYEYYIDNLYLYDSWQ